MMTVLISAQAMEGSSSLLAQTEITSRLSRKDSRTYDSAPISGEFADQIQSLLPHFQLSLSSPLFSFLFPAKIIFISCHVFPNHPLSVSVSVSLSLTLTFLSLLLFPWSLSLTSCHHISLWLWLALGPLSLLSTRLVSFSILQPTFLTPFLFYFILSSVCTVYLLPVAPSASLFLNLLSHPLSLFLSPFHSSIFMPH